MYSSQRFFLLFFGLLVAVCAQAQLSPGKLAEAHKDLEGMFNCTKCHDLGDKVSNAKCLDCHKEINNRIKKGQGYHASKEVKGKDCFTCHSDHHGRNFEMVRFDEDAFNHDWTGYKLTGSHKTTDCRECHQPDNIQEPKYKGNKTTFLGLSQDCKACHEDVHQKTLGTDCAKCHNTKEFAPAELFDHSKTDFALFGKHANVACIECHKKETRNGKEFQRFTDIPHSRCTDCHKDPHTGNLGTNCTQCHNEKGWESFIGKGRFDHNRTGFPLNGRHNYIDCAKCHNFKAGPARLFQENRGVKPNECATCHDDVHDGKFGTNCAECHNERSWRVGQAKVEGFDHDLTDYPLRGKHETVDCRKCHTSESMTDPVAHARCMDCHEDFHKGQFVQGRAVALDCAECHTVDGFQSSTYGFERHNQTDFPLEGAHMATPCFACHVSEGSEEWRFVSLGTRCVDCHENVHKETISDHFFPNQDCAQCHTVEAWSAISDFDHSTTNFVLEGKHATVGCAECHTKDEAYPAGKFKGLQMECTACHENIHKEQFAEKNGTTDCRRCHAFEDWTAVGFDHSKTKFPLEGKHAEVECSACHKPDEQDFVLYKMKSFECVDCHGE